MADPATGIDIGIISGIAQTGAIGAVAWLAWKRLGDVTDSFVAFLKTSSEKQVEQATEAAVNSERLIVALTKLEKSISDHNGEAKGWYRELMAKDNPGTTKYIEAK